MIQVKSQIYYKNCHVIDRKIKPKDKYNQRNSIDFETESIKSSH